jgi:hypothetical protein
MLDEIQAFLQLALLSRLPNVVFWIESCGQISRSRHVCPPSRNRWLVSTRLWLGPYSLCSHWPVSPTSEACRTLTRKHSITSWSHCQFKRRRQASILKDSEFDKRLFSRKSRYFFGRYWSGLHGVIGGMASTVLYVFTYKEVLTPLRTGSTRSVANDWQRCGTPPCRKSGASGDG